MVIHASGFKELIVRSVDGAFYRIWVRLPTQINFKISSFVDSHLNIYFLGPHHLEFIWCFHVSFVAGRGCHTVLSDQHSDRQSHWGVYRGRSSDATFRIVCRSWRPLHVLYYVSWDSGFLITSKHQDEACVVLQDEADNYSYVSPVSSDRTL